MTVIDTAQPAQYDSVLANILATHPDLLSSYDINNPGRVTMFLATLGAESNFKSQSEIPSQYASSRLVDHGRGVGQITGIANYAAIGKLMGLDFVGHPDLLNDPITGLEAAAVFAKMNGLNQIADGGDFDAYCRRWNGPGFVSGSRDDWYNKVDSAMEDNDDNAAAVVESLDPYAHKAPAEVAPTSKPALDGHEASTPEDGDNDDSDSDSGDNSDDSSGDSDSDSDTDPSTPATFGPGQFAPGD